MATAQTGTKKQKLQVLKELNNTLQLHAERLKLADRNELFKAQTINEKQASRDLKLKLFDADDQQQQRLVTGV